MPSEFSNLGQRMTNVFQQFATDEQIREITYPVKFNSKGVAVSPENSINLDTSKIGPLSMSFNSAKSRVLVVDDQVFNIEFLRCQLELIPKLAGRCDYVDNGVQAVRLVSESI